MITAKTRRVLLAALLALALPLTLAACGSDDGGEDTETSASEPETEETTPAEDEGEEDEGDETAAGGEVHVVGKDFMFEGIPATLDAGSYTFHFENAGKEEHELLVFQLNTDTPVEDLIKLPQKEAMKQITPMGGTFAAPGETAEKPLEAEFGAGNYAAVCFVSNKKGPHAFQGMVHEFTVE